MPGIFIDIFLAFGLPALIVTVVGALALGFTFSAVVDAVVAFWGSF